MLLLNHKYTLYGNTLKYENQNRFIFFLESCSEHLALNGFGLMCGAIVLLCDYLLHCGIDMLFMHIYYATMSNRQLLPQYSPPTYRTLHLVIILIYDLRIKTNDKHTQDDDSLVKPRSCADRLL